MTNPNDPAFLTEPKTFYLRQPPLDCDTSYGLTKRELIAAMAMQGMCANNISYGIEESWDTARAKYSVRLADALIAELNKEVK